MFVRTTRRGLAALTIAAAILAAACGKDTKPGSGATAAAGEKPKEAGATSGHTIVVELYTDSSGNYFKPAEIEAKVGDVVRFTLKMGVHNVHFLPDSNAGKSGLPPASDMLQLPDQTYDLPVSFAKGTYYFQCDPHEALGMKGHLKVE